MSELTEQGQLLADRVDRLKEMKLVDVIRMLKNCKMKLIVNQQFEIEAVPCNMY